MNVVAEMLREKDQEIQALKADLYWAQLEIAVLAGEDKHSEFVHSIFDGGQRAHLHAWTQESMIRTLKWQLDDLRAQLQFMQIRLDHALRPRSRPRNPPDETFLARKGYGWKKGVSNYGK